MRKPQPWPGPTTDHAQIILQHNDLLLLSLVVSYNELKTKDNLGMLAGLLPSLEKRATIIYSAAVELGPYIEALGGGMPPLWATQTNRIVKDYPALLLRLKEIEALIRPQRVIEIRRMLVEVFTIAAPIQIELMKIGPAAPKKRILFLPPYKLTQISEELKHR
jgi:hypothetical protein